MEMHIPSLFLASNADFRHLFPKAIWENIGPTAQFDGLIIEQAYAAAEKMARKIVSEALSDQAPESLFFTTIVSNEPITVNQVQALECMLKAFPSLGSKMNIRVVFGTNDFTVHMDRELDATTDTYLKKNLPEYNQLEERFMDLVYEGQALIATNLGVVYG